MRAGFRLRLAARAAVGAKTTTLALAISVVSVLTLGLGAEAFLALWEARTERGIRGFEAGDVVVFPEAGELTFPDAEEALAKIRELGYRASAITDTFAFVASRSEPLAVAGVDPASVAEVLDLTSAVTAGRFPATPGEGGWIVLGVGVAEHLGVVPGDEALVEVVSDDGRTSGLSLRVAGVLTSPSPAVNADQAYIARSDLARAGVTGTDRIVVAAPARPFSVAFDVAEQTGFRALAWQDTEGDYDRVRDATTLLYALLRALIVLVTAVGVRAVTLTALAEQARELAVLQVLGLQDRLVRNIVMLRLFIVLVVASLAALLLASIAVVAAGSVGLGLPGPTGPATPRPFVSLSSAAGLIALVPAVGLVSAGMSLRRRFAREPADVLAAYEGAAP